MKKVKINDHTKFKTGRRSISEEIIKSVVENPQQKLPSRKDRVILQSRYYDTNEGKEMLLRVIGIRFNGGIQGYHCL